jgi:hypothetical protein
VSFLNNVVEFCKVIASSVSGSSGATFYDVAGIAGFEPGDAGEQAHEQEVFQSLGVIGRPLPPDADLFAEALAVRTEDGLLPIAFRDLRLHRAVNPSGSATTPREGQTMFVGYGGAFLSHSMTAAPTGSKRGNVLTLYCPHAFDADGVPQKAHAITLDPSDGNSSISIAHASGLFLAMTEDAGSGPGIVASVDGATFFRMSAGEFVVSAMKIVLKGSVYLGRAAELGAPLLAGPTSPPCPSLFVSSV